MKKIYLLLMLILSFVLVIGCVETNNQNNNQTPTEHTEHIDRNNDSFCDICALPMPTVECKVHMDDDGDGICDVCGKNLKTNDCLNHEDLNNDGLCDHCGMKIETLECAFHMDDDGDGICDVCGKTLNVKETLNATFVLNKKTVSNIDVTNNYLYHYLSFKNNGEALEVIVDGTGISTTTYNYEIEDDQIILKQGIYEYQYAYNKEEATLKFSGMIAKRKVVMEYAIDASFTIPTSASDSVSFTSELFGDNLDESFYNYCPSAFMENSDTMYVYYCGNLVDGNVTDYIMMREGKLNADGTWHFGEKQIALEHGANGTWDARHACDPSVIKGIFNYQGIEYHYLMAYLGCYTSNGNCNEVGLAVSNNPAGPWVKVGDQTKAFRSYYDSTDFGSDGAAYWGYGQPSLLSVDKEGLVLLFYTKGVKNGTFTAVEEWDLSNLDNPQMLREAKLNDSGSIGIFNNADFAYDEINNCIYVIKEDHENGWYPSDGGVNWISGSNSIYYLSCNKDDDEFADVLFKNNSWAKVITIGKNETGFPRVHNCGLLTDGYGRLTNYEKIGVLYTMSYLATDYPDWPRRGQWPALHTYRIYGYIVER